MFSRPQSHTKTHRVATASVFLTFRYTGATHCFRDTKLHAGRVVTFLACFLINNVDSYGSQIFRLLVIFHQSPAAHLAFCAVEQLIGLPRQLNRLDELIELEWIVPFQNDKVVYQFDFIEVRMRNHFGDGDQFAVFIVKR